MGKHHDIDSLLDDVITLPSLPDSVERLTQLIDSPDCPLSEVARVISSDPALAIKTLRLINSAYYGLSNPVTTIEHAVVLLGAKVIKNLALTATVFDSMSKTAGAFLAHCVGCGVAMGVYSRSGAAGRMIASGDEAFLFGLLHDIGRVIFVETMPREYAEVVNAARNSSTPLCQIERELIGADHAELGGRLAERWRLNPPMIDAIAGHHDPMKVGENFRSIAATLGLADYTAYESGMPSFEGIIATAPPELWNIAEVNPAHLPEILDNYFELFPSIQEFSQLFG